MGPLEFQGARYLKRCDINPFCASTHGAQTCMKFCTHICLNVDIVVSYSYDGSTW
jgi:hypothetical protein